MNLIHYVGNDLEIEQNHSNAQTGLQMWDQRGWQEEEVFMQCAE
jgi:hypothetical protein